MSFKIRVCSAVAALLIFCLLLSACRMSDIQDGEEDNAPVGDPSAALPDPDKPAYEQQLAVACASVLPFCFPGMSDFRIYIASETDARDCSASLGVRMVVQESGKTYTVHAYPIDEQRTQTGTRDVYCPALGYAAFDIYEGEQLPANEKWREVPYNVTDSLSGIVTGTRLYEH